jgi:hypothetical protein
MILLSPEIHFLSKVAREIRVHAYHPTTPTKNCIVIMKGARLLGQDGDSCAQKINSCLILIVCHGSEL